MLLGMVNRNVQSLRSMALPQVVRKALYVGLITRI